VHISTFSVYDYLKTPSHTLIDENSPLESVPENRDEYAQTKLIQEDLVISTAQRNNWKYTVLRPGVLYGPDNLWTARLGVRSGERLWIRTGARAILPLNYVENCAQVIVLAAEKEEANGQLFNVVDDDMPQQRPYIRLLRRQMTPPPRIVPVSWTVMRFLAHSAKLTNKYLFGNRAKIPGILVPAKLHARIKPLRYGTATLKSMLGWQPRYSLETALDRVKQRAQAPTNQPAEATA
jgi:nucleoside-diphosphate-sugar epimerase